MLQTKASVATDATQFVPKSAANMSFLFIEVDDSPDTMQRLAGYPIALEERIAFYGMRKSVFLSRMGMP
jgi:hypothetical protein